MRIICISITFLTLLSASLLAGTLSKCYKDKIPLMIDVCQYDKQYRDLPGKGGTYCGPAAAANAIITLSRMGFERISDSNGQELKDRMRLLEDLGSDKHMKTGSMRGTSPVRVMSGTISYIAERGYRASAEWHGWRNGGEFCSKDHFDEEWLCSSVIGASNAVISVGWYKRISENEYSRVGGHYMTVVGYDARKHPCIYYIQDPAPRSGKGVVTHKVTIKRLGDSVRGPWSNARSGTWKSGYMMSGVVVKPIGDCAILDGVIRLKVSRNKN